jgi:hypothetical protein
MQKPPPQGPLVSTPLVSTPPQRFGDAPVSRPSQSSPAPFMCPVHPVICGGGYWSDLQPCTPTSAEEKPEVRPSSGLASLTQYIRSLNPFPEAEGDGKKGEMDPPVQQKVECHYKQSTPYAENEMGYFWNTGKPNHFVGYCLEILIIYSLLSVAYRLWLDL